VPFVIQEREDGTAVAQFHLTARNPLARIMHEGWRAWSEPLSGNRIRMRPLNPAVFGNHARQG
jgi:hypothetical protein